VAIGLLGNESFDSNKFTLVTPKSENDVRLQATLGDQNHTGLPVGAVRKEMVYILMIIRMEVGCFINMNMNMMKIMEK
jgi:hypothetical protein